MDGTDRRLKRRAGTLLLGLLGVGTTLVLGPVTGYGTVAAAQVAPTTEAPAPVPAGEVDELAMTEALPVEASAPEDPAEGVTVTGGEGAPDLDLGLPLPAGSEAVEQSAARTVYQAAGDQWSLVVEQPDASTLRATMVIDGPDAPTSFPFDLGLAGGASLLPQDDGTVAVLDADGEINLVVQAPWGRDANGADIPTHFTVDGTVLTQHVEHGGAAYPVQADPEFTWGNVTGTVYFNRDETLRVSRDYFYVALALGYACPNAPCKVVVAAQSGNIQAAAGRFYNQGDCIKVKIPGAIPYRLEAGTRNCQLK
jgi:hypothetical protein